MAAVEKHGVQPEGRLEAVLVAVLLGGYWVLQLVFAFVLEVQPTCTWDFGLVFSAAQQYAQSGVLPGDYFSQFHNNAPCTWCWWLFSKCWAPWVCRM